MVGKTLTMIALIMLSNNREESEEKVKSSDEEQSEENPNKGWSAKGRKDCMLANGVKQKTYLRFGFLL